MSRRTTGGRAARFIPRLVLFIAAGSLSSCGREKADAYRRELKSDDAEQRVAAVHSLREAHDPGAVELLVVALADRDVRVRTAAGAVLETDYPHPMREIHQAAAAGEQPRLEAVLREHPDWINAQDYRGNTPLNTAILKDRMEIVKALVSRGADVNLANIYGDTPVHLAALHGRPGALAFLLERGANADAANRRGDRPAILAIKFRHKTPAELLVAKGVDVNAGPIPLLHGAMVVGWTDLAKTLVDKGADVNAREQEFGATPLHVAAHWGCTDLVRLLLKRGADAAAVDDNGDSPLDLAIRAGRTDAAELLQNFQPQARSTRAALKSG